MVIDPGAELEIESELAKEPREEESELERVSTSTTTNDLFEDPRDVESRRASGGMVERLERYREEMPLVEMVEEISRSIRMRGGADTLSVERGVERAGERVDW
jgi:hypothetical protein